MNYLLILLVTLGALLFNPDAQAAQGAFKLATLSKVASQHQIPTKLLASVVCKESNCGQITGWDNSKQYYGVGQLSVYAMAEMGITNTVSLQWWRNSASSVIGDSRFTQLKYVAQYLKIKYQKHGTLDKALQAYSAGDNAMYTGAARRYAIKAKYLAHVNYGL